MTFNLNELNAIVDGLVSGVCTEQVDRSIAENILKKIQVVIIKYDNKQCVESYEKISNVIKNIDII